MRPRPHRCLHVLLLAGAGGCYSPDVRLYDGEPRPAGEVSRILDSAAAGLVAVDDEPVELGSAVFYALLPGEHEVVIGRIAPHADRPSSLPDQTAILTHDFEPGVTYTFESVYRPYDPPPAFRVRLIGRPTRGE